MEQKLKKARPECLTTKERAYLWQSIKSTINNNNYFMNSFSFVSILRKSRSAVIVLLISILSLGSYGTVTYANNSTPGDFLFPIDLATEKIRLAFSSRERKDELLVKYSEERLDEAKTKIKLVYTSITPIQNATSTSAGINASTTPTATSTQVTGTSTVLGTDVDRAQKTLLFALEHLKANKAELLARGNTNAALVLDSIIAELTHLAEDQLSTLERVAVEIKVGDDISKTRITATNEDVKTRFNVSIDKKNVSIKFETKENNGNNNNSDKNKGSIFDKNDKKDGSWKKNNDNNQSNRNDKNDKKNNNDKKITICHNDKETITISTNALSAHKAHGDTLGRCNDHNYNDDDDNQKSIRFKNIIIASQETSAKIKWNTDEKSIGTVWFSTSTPVMLSTSTAHVTDTRLDDDHKIVLVSLIPNTKYYFVILAERNGKTGTSTEQSFITKSLTTPPDTTAPTISNFTASNTPTTAHLSFNTNEQSVGRLFVATSTPTTEENSFFNQTHVTATSHEWSITGLSGNTTYYAIAVAKDSAGNTATSSTISFTTPHVPDTVAPVISSLLGTVTSTTTANITFVTNENSLSKLWFGTSTPLSVSGTPFGRIGTATTNHLYALTDLATSTIYYFIVNATDGAGNTSTSTEQNFSI